MYWATWKIWAAFVVFGVLVNPLRGQDTEVLLIGQSLGVAADRSLGLEEGTSPSVNNSALLNASFADSAQRYAIYFPGGRWEITEPIVATNTSRALIGNGIGRPGSGNGWGINRGPTSRLVWEAGVLSLDGTSVYAEATGAANTIHVVGYSVVPSDVLETLSITGGSGFIQGTYHINSVNTSANTWTLDRNCNGGSATGMAGVLKGTILRDDGFGNNYTGLSFQGSTNYVGTPNPNSRAAIGWQQRPRVDGVTPNTGKAALRDCTFEDLDVGILLGKGLARFNESPPAQDYDGKADNNADLFYGERLVFEAVTNAIVVRTGQSVQHTLSNITARTNVPTVIYCERGGKLLARDVWMTSGGANGPTLLRIGGGGGSPAATVESPIVIDGTVFDAPSTSLKLLEMDGTGNTEGTIILRNVPINKPKVNDVPTDYSVPIATVKDGWKLVLDNVGPLQAGSIKIEAGVSGYIPHVVVTNCRLIGITNQEDVIENGGPMGAKIDFYGNSNANNSIVYDNKRHILP